MLDLKPHISAFEIIQVIIIVKITTVIKNVFVECTNTKRKIYMAKKIIKIYVTLST